MRVVPFIFNHSSEGLSVTKLVTLIKCLTAREAFQRSPNVNKMLWGGVFANNWSQITIVSNISGNCDLTPILFLPLSMALCR